MKASRPRPSTVSTPERMLRRMSSASSRTRLSSVARVACSIPASRSRCPSTATIAKTTLNTTIWAQNGGVQRRRRGSRSASARKSGRREDRRQRAPGRRHEQGVGRHHQHVERRKRRLGLPGEMDDGGDHAQVHQRLDQQERVARLPPRQEHRPGAVAGERQGDDHRDADEERFLGPLGPDQPGAQQDADRQDQAADEQPGEQGPLVRQRAPACPVVGWHRALGGLGVVEGFRRR